MLRTIAVLLIMIMFVNVNELTIVYAATDISPNLSPSHNNAEQSVKGVSRSIQELKPEGLDLARAQVSLGSARKDLPISIQKNGKHQFKANEDVNLTITNPDQEDFTTTLTDADGKAVEADIRQIDNGTTTDIVITANNHIKPGKYTLQITDQNNHTVKQDFTWGVLAINTDRSFYRTGQTAAISIAVLNENGDMVCDANVTLTITRPDAQVDVLSTKEGHIVTNKACFEKDFSLDPDYQAFYELSSLGTYALHLNAVTKSGTYSIDDALIVKNDVAFDVERKAATRIYPPLNYPVEITVTANRDFTGTITETVPDSFTIIPSDQADSYDVMNTLYFDKQKNPTNILNTSKDKLAMPFDGDYSISQGFGIEVTEPTLRNLYIRYGLGGHDGIDFAMPIGTPIYAVDDGTVLLAGDGDYGITVVIQHTWGRSYYGHLSNTTVEQGLSLKKGHRIGLSGNTGESTGPHLHFGMKPQEPDLDNGYIGKVDPLPYLPLSGTSQTSLLSFAHTQAVLGASTSATGQAPLITESEIEASAPAQPNNQKNLPQDYTIKADEIFKEIQQSESPVVEKVKIITWNIAMKKGDKTTLSYTYKAPQESPQFYVTGPLKFFENATELVFEENRKWQIAADAVGDDWYDKAWEYRKEITLLGDTAGGWCNIATGATCNTNWTARRKITINNSASATNLTNFPLLVVLNSSRIDYAKTQTNGQDLRFVDADGTTLLSHEIENYDESGNEYVWVKVPQINTGSSDYIWMYYGNAGASDGQSGTSVWDSNYRIVHHLNESGSPYQDATSNNKDGSEGTNPPVAYASGKVAGGQDFDPTGSGDFYNVSSPNLPTGDFTYSVWSYADTSTGLQSVMSANVTGNQYEFGMTIDTTFDVWTNHTYRFNNGGAITTGSWQYYTFTRSGSNLTIYVNGAVANTSTDTGAAFTFDCGANYRLTVGDSYWGCTVDNNNKLDGKLDELRVSATARSADWVEAEYLSMNDSMNTYGAEETTSSTLSNFPVLVSFSADADLSAKAQPDGDDILFTTSDGRTKLSHEIESYSAGTLLAWVKIPTLAMYSDTKIFIYYGNTGTVSQQDATNVWDSNYRASWHMDENAGTTASDSTSYVNSLTLSSASWNGTGKIGPAWNGTGAQWLSRTDDDDFDFAAADTLSIGMWFKSDSATNPSATQYLLDKSLDTTQTAGYAIYTKTTGVFCFGIDDDTTWSPDDEACSTTDYYDNSWHYLYATKNGTSGIQIYIDGALAGSDSSLAATGTLANAKILYLGDRQGTDGTDEFVGDLDQTTISRSIRNDSWITTEYRNQNAPVSFRTVGGEETYIFAPTMSEVMRHGKFFDTRATKQPFAF